ncbi:hypothetical protein [Nonomuraea longicatena]|uniref:Uncharacterized protein n=1 Tax=Nonomuraea longicatena TaxID=83682 RepID=A0ABP3Z8G9_9ACTN
MPDLREHVGRHYAVQFHYSLPDDAWCIELSEAVPVPESWTDIPGSPTHLPGLALMMALVPDEDPAAEPTVHLGNDHEHVIPYEIVRWFMEKVAAEVERCHATLAAIEPATDTGPDLS